MEKLSRAGSPLSSLAGRADHKKHGLQEQLMLLAQPVRVTIMLKSTVYIIL